jgi:hypothetical protein
MGVERDTLEERYAVARRSLGMTGFAEGNDGVWRKGNRTARLVEQPNTYRGGPVPEFIDGKPVDPIHKEPKLLIEYGEE